MGIKAEVEVTAASYSDGAERKGRNEWVEIGVEVPGMRDDDSMPVFLAAMLGEALLADGGCTGRLWINGRFHWKLYIDVFPPSFFSLNFLTCFRSCYYHKRSRIHCRYCL